MDDKRQIVALHTYQAISAKLLKVMEVQASWGKWLVGSLLATHAGAIFIIASSGAFEKSVSSWAFYFFVAGVLLAIICGFVAWINWSLQQLTYMNWQDARMIVYEEVWPDHDSRLGFWTDFTNWAAIVVGIASALCLPLGAWCIASVPVAAATTG